MKKPRKGFFNEKKFAKKPKGDPTTHINHLERKRETNKSRGKENTMLPQARALTDRREKRISPAGTFEAVAVNFFARRRTAEAREKPPRGTRGNAPPDRPI